jgi:formylglycine-generating enzyme required for sulfatase activity
VAGSQDSAGGARQPQGHFDTGEPKATGAGAEASTVSYTEILSSWTPAEAASEHHSQPSDAAAPTGRSSTGEQTGDGRFDSSQNEVKSSEIRSDEVKGDELIVDELKTTAMPALDLSAGDLLPTESLPTGPLPGSRPTSVFGPKDLPVEALGAPVSIQDHAQGAGQAPVADDNWVVTSHEFAQAQNRQNPPVDPDTNAPEMLATFTPTRDNGQNLPELQTPVAAPFDKDQGPPAPGPGATSEQAGAVRDWQPPPVPTQAGLPPLTSSQPPAANTPASAAQMPPDTEGPGSRSKQVPPEVAHYMAYMDRQAAPQSPPHIPAPQPGQPGQAKKSSLLPIALATGFLAILILAGLGFLIYRFQQRQKQNLAGTATPQSSVSVDVPAAHTPQPEQAPTVQEVVAPEGMVLVAAGTYVIGRDDGDKLAGPKHAETLSSFFIDKTETTNAAYKRFVDATGHPAPTTWRDKAFPEGKANYPVTDVTWQDAADFAAWAGKRLPSEAEWEAAARGKDGRAYPWGNEWRTDAANIGGTAGIVEVGKFPDGAAASGALDMIGNVWEWTVDEFRLYPGNTATLRDLVEPGIEYRVIRGGAYDSNKKNDASYRGYIDASKGYPKTGFRCVKNADIR